MRQLALAISVLASWSGATPGFAKDLYVFPEIFSTENNPLEVLRPASINSLGQVAFRASYADVSYSSILRGHIGTVEILADDTGPIVEFTSDPSINDVGDVAFSTQGGGFASNVFRYTSAVNGLVTIADAFEMLGNVQGASLHNSGVVLFHARTTTERSIVLGNGTTSIPVAATSASDAIFERSVINRADPMLEFAYHEFSGGQNAIIRGAPLTTYTTIAEEGPTFERVESYISSISNAGVVGFAATPVGGVSTLYTSTGGAPTVVADASGEFRFFYQIAVSNAGAAFSVTLDTGPVVGVFNGPSTLNDKVVVTGEAIPGYASTVSFIQLSPEGMNDRGQIALHVGFLDGTERILRADPIGSLDLVHESDRAVAALKTDTFSVISQAMSTPQGDEVLEFEYYFATTGGELTVMLEDEVVARIPARDQLVDGFTSVRIPVDVQALFPTPPDELTLKFTLAGTGETAGLLIDNVRFGDVENGDFGRGDLSGWQREFGGGDGGVGVAVSPFAVPEPAGFFIALVGAIGTSLFLVRRRRSKRSLAAALVRIGIVAALVLAARPSEATDLYLFPEIFSTENNPLQNLRAPSINALGQVAFWAEYADGSYSGILRGSVGTIEILANNTGPIRSFPSRPSINDHGDVAFSVTGDAPDTSSVLRYTSSANGLDTIAESGLTFTFLLGASLHNDGAVAFGALTATQELIAVGNGLTTVFIDGNSDPAINFFGQYINRAGAVLEVAYVVDRPSSTTVVKGDSLSKTTIAETGPAFTSIREIASISNAGVVAFVARPVGGVDTLYTGAGGAPTVVADTLGDFTEFREVAVSNAGIAFRTHLAGAPGSHGVFTGPSVLNDKIVARGDAIPGYPSTVDQVELMAEGMNDHGQIALRVSFVDGTERILRADPIGSLQQILEFRRAVAAMRTDSMSSMSQAVGMPEGDELLEFDYYFATTGGELTVMLEDEVLARIPARDQLVDGFTTVRIPVDVQALFPIPPEEVMLKFTLSGTGETAGLLIDNVRFGDVENGDFGRGDLSGWQREFGDDGGVGVAVSPFPIPEPTALLTGLIAAVGASAYLARRRTGTMDRRRTRDSQDLDRHRGLVPQRLLDLPRFGRNAKAQVRVWLGSLIRPELFRLVSDTRRRQVVLRAAGNHAGRDCGNDTATKRK